MGKKKGLTGERIFPGKDHWGQYFLFALVILALLVGCSRAPDAPPVMPNINRTRGPDLPANPDQADLGSVTYWMVCMACHGNRGQGLTDEWREAWGPQEMNCWQSRCHASNHPPEGFDLPRSIPAVIGATALARFKTAEDLHRYIKDTMPWWKPGMLTDEEAWNTTAYLMKAQGAWPEGIVLDATNAAVFPIHQRAPSPNADRPALLLIAGVLAMAAFMIVVGKLRSKQR